MKINDLYEDSVDAKISLNGVFYDQENGLGAVPSNQNVDYEGFVVLMKPLRFIDMVRSGASVKPFMVEWIKEEKPIGSPFLIINTEDRYIRGHEGRHRCLAVNDVLGNVPMLVHCFVAGGRARHVTIDEIKEMAVGGLGTEYSHSLKMPGTNFIDKVWHMGKWHTL